MKFRTYPLKRSLKSSLSFCLFSSVLLSALKNCSHLAFLKRQELEKQQKNEPKKPENENNNDYRP